MPFQKVYDPSVFDRFAEFGMGYHVVNTYPRPGQVPDIFILFNQEFLLPIDEIDIIDPSLINLAPQDMEASIRQNAPTLRQDLQPCDPGLFASHSLLQRMTSSASGRPSAPPPAAGTPAPTPAPYGHLPFRRQTASDHERFVRYTVFSTDHRIRPNGEVLPGTFAAPASEERVVPGGFAAVGRFAMPSLLPAIWRRDIVPPANTSYMCGAVVPMFGQAGGGAEVQFDNGALAGSAHLRVASIPEL